MNQDFINHALSYGLKGEHWLKRIPDTIEKYEKKWHFSTNPPFDLSYNYVAPADRADGTKVVLKIGFPNDPEVQKEIDALTVFNGEGSIRLIEVDRGDSVMLLEKVIPGIPLSTIEDDEKATRILAQVMKSICKPLPENNSFITVSEWMQAIQIYKEKHYHSEGNIPQYLIDKAMRLCEELFATSATPVLVHGDLHHDNVLSSDRESWLAIDPKGIIAEPAYETAAMIRNPYNRMKNVSNLEDVLRKRILILAEELNFEPSRIHKWCFTQTVLSAVWNDDELKTSDHAVRVAVALHALNI